MASHLETELGKLRSIIIKIGGLKIRSLKLLRQCFQSLLESKEVKENRK
jgi:hypothetical protein